MTPQPHKPIDCPAHPAVNDDLTLIKYELGIKEQRNGERDRQIKYAWNRINGIGKKTEQEDNTLREDLNKVKEDVNTLKVDIAVIKQAVLQDEKNKDRKWSRKDKIITGVTVGIIIFLITFFIEFNWKTFILGI